MLNGGASFGFGTASAPRGEAFSYPATERFLLALSPPIFLPRHQLILPPSFGKFKPRRSVQQEGTARVFDPQSGPSVLLSHSSAYVAEKVSQRRVRQEIRDKISKKGGNFPFREHRCGWRVELSNCLSHREGHQRDAYLYFISPFVRETSCRIATISSETAGASPPPPAAISFWHQGYTADRASLGGVYFRLLDWKVFHPSFVQQGS